MLEAGLVRTKNSINVAQKNIADFITATCVFFVVGFAIMFGPSVSGLVGWGDLTWRSADDWTFTFFVFQLVFCGTAATIVSGAVAERMKFSGYLIITVVITGLIYPVFGHWAWGNLLIGDNTAWLADRGFIDFAGSTVVHSVGGWVSLAALLVIGPRIGRFAADGTPKRIHGHSVVLATAGCIVLWIGWIGFNAGSTTAGTPDIGHIAVNTVLAGGAGGLMSLLIGRWRDGLYRPERAINGVLAGLVGITAGCDALSAWSAAIVGLSSGCLVIVATDILERVFKIDDVIGAVAVHGVCGAWGTILVAVLAQPDKLVAATRLDQLLVQAEGVAVAFVWAFFVSFSVLKLLDRIVALRASAEQEIQGLNEAEHGATLGTGLIQKTLHKLATGDEEVSRRLDESTGDEAGEVAYAFNLLMDKVDRSDSDLRVAIAESEHANCAKSEFLANMSHEIRTPMNGILGMADLLSRSNLPPRQQRFVGTIRQSAETLLGIFNDVLDFSRIEAGKFDIDSVRFDLRGAVGDVVDLLADSGQKKRLEVVYFIADDIPDQLRGDVNRMHQVLINLMGNAIKFTESGEVSVRVTTTGEDADTHSLHFVVTDTGIGIEPKVQEQLFEAFHQADGSITRNYGGTGLGLAISKQIVHLMDGNIGVMSTPGRGSSVWFMVPLAKCPEEPMAAPREPRSDLAAVRALVVDDNATNREILNEYLTTWGLSVVEAEGGPQALTLLREGIRTGQRFELAILDMTIPGMSGIDLARLINCDADLTGLSMVMLTSINWVGDREEGRDAGIKSFLTKPVRASELHDVLGNVFTTPREATASGRMAAADDTAELPEGLRFHHRILLAEDNPVNQEVAREILRELGCRVANVTTGRAAVTAFQRSAYDLVLMDCQMPEMDGLKATRLIRDHEKRAGVKKRTPIIALTANAFEKDREECLASGMDDYLSKPYKLDDLGAKLARWLPVDISTNRVIRDAGKKTRPAFAATSDEKEGDRGAILDQAIVDRIRSLDRGDGSKVLDKIIEIYLHTAPKSVAELRLAVEAGDCDAVRRTAHSLKSSSANLGATSLTNQLHELERKAHDKTLGDAVDRLAAIEAEFERAQRALQAELSGGTTTEKSA